MGRNRESRKSRRGSCMQVENYYNGRRNNPEMNGA